MRLINVTAPLSVYSNYSGIRPEVLEAAKQRGLRLHAAAAAYLTGTFQVVELLPEDAGYWESLRFWIDDYVDHVFDVEPELTDEALGYVGHPDLICRIGKNHRVVDWKTPANAGKSWGPQLAAYVALAEKNYRHHSHYWSGMVIQPDKDGKLAKAILYPHNAQDYQVFLSALNCHRYFNSKEVA